jgi:hypothetical protein
MTSSFGGKRIICYLCTVKKKKIIFGVGVHVYRYVSLLYNKKKIFILLVIDKNIQFLAVFLSRYGEPNIIFIADSSEIDRRIGGKNSVSHVLQCMTLFLSRLCVLFV